jgi:hypothetical protein
MRYVILFFALLVIPQQTATAAETFSCKDSDGTLHIADNQMSLPTECRDQAITSEPDKEVGSVSYVPAAKQPSQPSSEFNQAVREEDRASKARKRRAAALVGRAQNLAADYENGVTTRKAAVRSMRYGTREDIIAAEQQVQTARSGKKKLRAELDDARLSTEQRQQIETQLNSILD